MNRRKLLTAAPAFGFAGLLAGAVPAIADTETPVMRMFREWQPLSAWLNGPDSNDVPEAEFDRINGERIDLENRIMDVPAQGPGDVLAKMLARTNYGEDEMLDSKHLPQVWAEARQMLAA